MLWVSLSRVHHALGRRRWTKELRGAQQSPLRLAHATTAQRREHHRLEPSALPSHRALPPKSEVAHPAGGASAGPDEMYGLPGRNALRGAAHKRAHLQARGQSWVQSGKPPRRRMPHLAVRGLDLDRPRASARSSAACPPACGGLLAQPSAAMRVRERCDAATDSCAATASSSRASRRWASP